MDQNIKTQWVAALRSGTIPQTTGKLARINMGPDGSPPGRCCLGVLCDLAVEAGVIPQPVPAPGDDYLKYGDGAQADADTLPRAVAKWAGLVSALGRSDTNPALPSGVGLAELNDDGSTFATIADLIEEYL